MWFLAVLSSFIVAVGLHAIVARLRPDGNRVRQFLATGALAGLWLIVQLTRTRGTDPTIWGATLGVYAFACELYIFLFTGVTSSVSVALLLSKRPGGNGPGLAQAMDSADLPAQMVQRRLQSMEAAGLLRQEGTRVALTARSRWLVRRHRALRSFFGHAAEPSIARAGEQKILPDSRVLTAMTGVFIALLFSAPFALAAWKRFEVFPIANESIAYRWGHPSRADMGDIAPILPQGFTILAFQQQLVRAIEAFRPLSAETLRSTLQFFSWGTFSLFIGGFFACLILAVRQARASADQLVLIFLPWIVAIYGTGGVGVYYCLLPDYYHLNATLACAAALFLFPFVTALIKDANLPPPSLKTVAGLGVVLGLGVANKITWAAPCLVALVAVMIAAPPRPAARLLRGALLGTAALLTFGFVLLAYYRMHPGQVLNGAREWIEFMKGQQGSMPLWGPEFSSMFGNYNYGTFYPLQLVTLGLALLCIRGGRARAFAVAGLMGFSALWWMAAQRPAGSTFWDVNVLTLLITSATVLAISRAGARIAILVLWMGVGGWAVWRHPAGYNLQSMAASRAAADNRFAVFQEINRFAAGRPQLVMILNNEYHHEGVHELLLKAAADFPSWNVTVGQAWLKHYIGDMTFYHEYGPAIQLPDDLSGSCIVWFDRPDLPLVSTRYPRLAEVQNDPAYETITLPIRAMNQANPLPVQMWVHAARRRLPAAASKLSPAGN